jgi:hypothetical protein
VDITHANSTVKNVVSSILSYDIPTTGVMVDINVVCMNNDTLSDYVYGGVFANFCCLAEGAFCRQSSTCCQGTVWHRTSRVQDRSEKKRLPPHRP